MRAWRELPPAVRRVLLGDLLSAVGTGLVLPFLFVYVAQVRGLGDAVGGLAIAAIAAGSLISNPIAGRAVDAWGARPVLQLGLLLAAAGDLALLSAHTAVAACAATALFGLGTGTVVPALHSLLGAATAPEHRPSAFALQYALTNVGFSVGALLSAVLVSFDDPASFVRVYAIDAATFVLFAAWLAAPAIRAGLAAPAGPEDVEDAPSTGGYRQVLADARFRRLCLVNALLVTCGFAQYWAALPAFAGRDGGLSAGQLALAFAANTLVVGGAQLPVLAVTRRMARPQLVSLGAACFAVCWVLVALSGPYGSAAAALLLVAAGAAVMALGETLLSPALGPLVNEMAPDHLRGRYNAVDTLVLSTGTVIGPVLAGWALAGGMSSTLFAGLTVGCLGAAVLARTLSTVVPEAQQDRPTKPADTA